MSLEESFYQNVKEQSLVKQKIVTKYFTAWSTVIVSTLNRYGGDTIAYLDLFSGPGKYEDGSDSTPLIILKKAIENPKLRDKLLTVFNDANTEYVTKLKENIRNLPGIETLRNYPITTNIVIDDDFIRMFEGKKHFPTLLFADPWGYKGLSLKLINRFIKHWGCECIIFFNYQRINPAIINPKQKDNMELLFGKERLAYLKNELPKLEAYDRQLLIIEKISEALIESGGIYVLPFCFQHHKKKRISHHIIFTTKNFLGYGIMKEIMAKESTRVEQGVPTFMYNHADKKYPVLFEFNRPLDDLEAMLLDEFSGYTISVKDIYCKHSPGRRYILTNYKEILNKLENKGAVKIDPPANRRLMRSGKRTLTNKAMVTFPRR